MVHSVETLVLHTCSHGHLSPLGFLNGYYDEIAMRRRSLAGWKPDLIVVGSTWGGSCWERLTKGVDWTRQSTSFLRVCLPRRGQRFNSPNLNLRYSPTSMAAGYSTSSPFCACRISFTAKCAGSSLFSCFAAAISFLRPRQCPYAPGACEEGRF